MTWQHELFSRLRRRPILSHWLAVIFMSLAGLAVIVPAVFAPILGEICFRCKLPIFLIVLYFVVRDALTAPHDRRRRAWGAVLFIVLTFVLDIVLDSPMAAVVVLWVGSAVYVWGLIDFSRDPRMADTSGSGPKGSVPSVPRRGGGRPG
jgi:uncharacterized membrane protein YhaH (DUF805 family)